MEKRTVNVVVLIAVCACLYFAHLQKGDLSAESEGNYAEIPREMLESGDWVIPRLNYVPYLEKPPLFYWLTAATYRVFGANAFAARFWSALPAMLLVLSLFVFLRHQSKARDAIVSALILATSAGMIAMARISYMDMLLCLCTAWAFFCFYQGESALDYAVKNRIPPLLPPLTPPYKGGEFCQFAQWLLPLHSLWFLGFFACLALAVLTKGLIGLVLPGMGILLYLAIQRRWAVQRKIPWIMGLTVFLAIALPWHLLAAAKNEKFFHFYFINEHWLRFLGQRWPKDYYEGPVYYQFLRVLLLFLPWSLFLPIAIARRGKEIFRDRLQCFAMCWFLGYLAFYTASKAKANYYMMPALPALAIFIGADSSDEKWDFLKGKSWGVFLIVLSLASIVLYALLALFPYPILKKLAPGAYPFVFGTSALLAVGLMASLVSACFFRLRASFGCFIATIAVGSFVLFSHPQLFDRRGSIFGMVELIEKNADAQTMLVLRGTFEKNSQLAFYTGKRFTIVSDQGDVGGDLDFGSRQPEGKGYFLQWPEFLRRFGGDEKILYVTWRESDYGELMGNHPAKCHLIARVAYRLLISNFPVKKFDY